MRQKILIIDNNKDFADAVKKRLEEKGCEVSCAYAGKRGIEKARAEKPDVIILELMLPEFSGYDVASLLKFDVKCKDIPIILCSSEKVDAVRLSRETGADAYVRKTKNSREFIDNIERLLSGDRIGTHPAPAQTPIWKEIKDMKDATIDELKLKIKRLAAVNEVAHDMNLSLEMDVCVKKFIDKVSSILAAEISSLMLLDKKKDELIMRMAKGLKDEIVKNARTKMGEGVAGWVAKEAKPLLVEDLKDKPEFRTKNGRAYKTDSFISVPLMVDKEVLGVVNVTDKSDKTSFTKEDLETLVSIANAAARTLKNSIIYEELKHIDQAKTDFLSTLSHELKTPLTNVKGSIALLLEDPNNVLTDEQKKFLSIAKDNIDRLTRLINDLLDIGRMEAGVMIMRRSRFNISDLVRMVASSFKAELGKRAIDLSVTLPADDKFIWGDPDRIEQVVTNLLSNAIKFTPQNGKVGISLEETADKVRITVSDTGSGIAKEDMSRLFDKFSSLAVEKEGFLKGTGLGLSISKDIVTLHKGSIWAESEVGKGSKFLIDFPKDLRKGR